jgi:integrase
MLPPQAKIRRLMLLYSLYNMVLQQPVDFPLANVRAKMQKRRPAILTREEVFIVLDCLHGRNQLMAQMLYASGLRLSECVRCDSS